MFEARFPVRYLTADSEIQTQMNLIMGFILVQVASPAKQVLPVSVECKVTIMDSSQRNETLIRPHVGFFIIIIVFPGLRSSLSHLIFYEDHIHTFSLGGVAPEQLFTHINLICLNNTFILI